MAGPRGTVIDFAMPSLGADMTEGRITEWLVHPGDQVRRGQIVVVVETDKSDIEVEVFEPGVIAELLVEEGELVPVGTPIARIEPSRAATQPSSRVVAPAPTTTEAPTEAPIEAPTELPAAPAAAPPPAPVTPVPEVPATPPEAHSVEHAGDAHLTSPVIRRLAEQLHVDPAAVHGSGPGGRVHRDDVERAALRPRLRITPRARRLAAEHALDPASVTGRAVVDGAAVLAAVQARIATVAATVGAIERPSRAETMRRHIATLMARSWQEIPHYHVSKRLDLTATTAALTAYNADRSLSERVVTGAVLLTAAARAAAAVPACNGWWRDERFESAPDVRLGVVLSLRTGGIVVPTIDHADELTVPEMMARLTELVQRARQGRLRASDMTEASLTVTNLGDLGAQTVTGVIHPPQVALVGFGAVHDDVWAIDGQVVVRSTVHATLSGDHRAIDGLTGSRFLTQLQTALDHSLSKDGS